MNKGAWALWKTLPRAFPYLKPYRGLMALSFVITFMGAAVTLAEPWPLAIIVDNVLTDKPIGGGPLDWVFGDDPSRYSLLAFGVIAGFLVTLSTQGLTVLSDWVNATIEQRMVLDLRGDLFNHAQGLSLTFHDGRMTGQLMQQINMQAAAMGVILISAPPIIQALLTLVGMLIVVTLISWQIALISLAAVPFIWYSLGLYGTKIVPRLQLVQAQEWKSLSIVHEAMSMLKVIVSFGRENHEFRRFRTQGEEAVEQRIQLTVRQTLFSLAVSSATAIGTSLVLGFGAWQVIQGDITLGELLVLIAYIAAVYQPLEQISTTIGELNDQFVQFNSSLDLLDEEKEVKEKPGAIDIPRSQGRVTFDDVHFAYRGRQDTLKGVSFEAKPGTRVAVVGPTGAGKTTLISLLIRFYDPKSGTVAIDGHDIRDLTLKSLREQISVVLQDPLLFGGTVADNIRYGKLDATDEEVVAAAKAANCHDFICALPEGYDTHLGERGSRLSGGERQRISVARAFIKDAPILILDEPTSSIDSKTEGVILDALEELMEGRTSFMIAHRLSTVRDADLILVLRDGELVEAGTHDELLGQEGAFHQLHEAQNRPRRRSRALAAVGAPSAPAEEPGGLPADDFDRLEGGGNGNGDGSSTTAEAAYEGLPTEPAPPVDDSIPAEELTQPEEAVRLDESVDEEEEPYYEEEPYEEEQAAPAQAFGAEKPRHSRRRRVLTGLLLVAAAALGISTYLTRDDGEQATTRSLPTGPLQVERVGVGGLPTGVAIARGYAYVSRGRTEQLFKVPLNSFDKAVPSYGVPARATDIEAAAGSLWVTSARPGALTGIDLDDGKRTTIPLEGMPTRIVAADGALWIATRSGEESSIVRVDPRAGRVTTTYPMPEGVQDMSAGQGGVWVSDRTESSVTRISTADGSRATFGLSGKPFGVAVTDGAIVAIQSRGAVVRLDADGPKWNASIEGGPRGVAEHRGVVWVTSFEKGTLSRLDVRDGNPLGAPVRVADEPTEVEAMPGAVFVLSQGEGQLERVKVP